MKIKCIKTYAYYWGTLFQENKFYDIVKTDMEEYEMISEKDKYLDVLRKITSTISEINIY